MMDLIARIDRWGLRTPDRVAHRSGDRTLTYGELLRRSNGLAAALTGLLPDDQSPIVVHGHKEPEMLIGFLGAVKAGHPYVPVDLGTPVQRLDRIVALSGARMTLNAQRIAALSEDPSAPPQRDYRADDPHYVLFTSGSTGEPKGVLITLGCLTHFLEWMLWEQDLREGAEVFLNQVIYAFDVSVMDSYTSLVTGGTIVSLTSDMIANPRYLYQTLRASGVTIWVSTPTFAQMCLAERSFGREMLPSLRRFLFCGETLPPAVAAQLLDRFPDAEVWNTYGPTEATVATTSIRIDREVLARYSPLPIGYPMRGSQVLVMDEALQRVPDGEAGEIIIAGANVSPGYLGRPDLTERAFFLLNGERAYRTGDRGHVRDGMVFYDGRGDRQIKLHGYRIELGDIEAHLCALPGVRDAVVLPVMKEDRPESLEAVAILSDRPAGLSDAEMGRRLRNQLGERLPAHMLPRRISLVEAFPMTPNGKVDRGRLSKEQVAVHDSLR